MDREEVAEGVQTLPRPDMRIKIDEEREVKMTYGLLMDLQRLLPEPTQVMNLVMSDPYTQDYVIRRVLTDKKGTVTKVEDLVDAEEVNLTPEQASAILHWVVQHILHFFAQRAGNLAIVAEQFKIALPSLFTDGSASSVSSTPSAGPSESPKTD